MRGGFLPRQDSVQLPGCIPDRPRAAPRRYVVERDPLGTSTTWNRYPTPLLLGWRAAAPVLGRPRRSGVSTRPEVITIVATHVVRTSGLAAWHNDGTVWSVGMTGGGAEIHLRAGFHDRFRLLSLTGAVGATGILGGLRDVDRQFCEDGGGTLPGARRHTLNFTGRVVDLHRWL
jgi:hypothetical protein